MPELLGLKPSWLGLKPGWLGLKPGFPGLRSGLLRTGWMALRWTNIQTEFWTENLPIKQDSVPYQGCCPKMMLEN